MLKVGLSHEFGEGSTGNPSCPHESYEPSKEIPQETFPLQVGICRICPEFRGCRIRNPWQLWELRRIPGINCFSALKATDTVILETVAPCRSVDTRFRAGNLWNAMSQMSERLSF